MTATAARRIELYDTTLRDGAQGEGISFTLADKLKITARLDALGVDYIEGGYPLSNPKDAAYFTQVRQLPLKHAKVCAFGMTRRKGVAPREDTGMNALVQSQAPVLTIVGKSWDLHVDQVLGVSREENLAMIRESLAFCREAGRIVFYDAEHFFDGFAANPDYALSTLRAALEGGAQRLILCDTNGGSLPSRVTQTIQTVRQFLQALPDSLRPDPDQLLGIHVHNDGGLAVANSLAAVQVGCVQVQGTINGIGERCGNVDLTTIAANLRLKLGCDCLLPDSLALLTPTSRFVYELANLNLVSTQPFVGSGAFTHKGGMHVHAVQKIAHSYEHVQPQLVGNSRKVLISELSGVSNVTALVGRKFTALEDKNLQRQLVARVAELENQGYQFETAQASFELLVHDLLGTRLRFWDLHHYRCVILKHQGQPASTEGTVKLRVGEQSEYHVAEGDGPVNALDGALRKCLLPHYPQIARVHLTDFKVRVVNATAESAAKVRVLVEFTVRDPQSNCPSRSFSTIGVNENIVDASWQALSDALDYHLIETHASPAPCSAKPGI